MKRFLAAAAGVGGLMVASGAAQAQSIIREPGNHDHSVEVEIHGFIDYGWHYDYAGYGAYDIGPGFRIGIPILNNGFVRSINNDVRINFGGDLHWLPGYTAEFFGWINSPVVMQWNFFLTDRWSVFGEAGLAFDLYLFNQSVGPNCYNHGGGNVYCDLFWFYPSFAGGARYHFGGHGGFPTLTMRLGYPVGFNIGVSF
jgi:hypothetical protein